MTSFTQEVADGPHAVPVSVPAATEDTWVVSTGPDLKEHRV